MAFEVNLDLFSKATIRFCVEYFGLSEEQASAKINLLWQQEDLPSITAAHPFFLAGQLAGYENSAIRKKYLANLTAIDLIWI